MTVQPSNSTTSAMQFSAIGGANTVIGVIGLFVGIACCTFACNPAQSGPRPCDVDGLAHFINAGTAAAQHDGNKEKAARQKSIDNLNQIGLAMHSYHDTYRRMPPHALYSKDGKTPLLSWRVAMLPFLRQAALYKKFKLDEPWDSEHNKALIAQMPEIYEPVGGSAKREGKTYYQLFVGSVFGTPKTRLTLAAITNLNGSVNTLAVVEAKNAVVWTKPEDLAIPGPDEKRLPVGGLFDDCWHAVFCDGSVRTLRNDMPISILRKMIDWTNNDPFDLEKYEKKDRKE